jgi:hypothetical protein
VDEGESPAVPRPRRLREGVDVAVPRLHESVEATAVRADREQAAEVARRPAESDRPAIGRPGRVSSLEVRSAAKEQAPRAGPVHVYDPERRLVRVRRPPAEDKPPIARPPAGPRAVGHNPADPVQAPSVALHNKQLAAVEVREVAPLECDLGTVSRPDGELSRVPVVRRFSLPSGKRR